MTLQKKQKLKISSGQNVTPARQQSPTFGFQWHLTDLCNGHCAHCYQESFVAGVELSPPEQISVAHKIFASLSGRKVSVNVTGGEPMLLDHLPGLLAHLADKPNLDELWLISNGTIAGKKRLEPISEIESFTGMKISVEAADPKINDAIRWPGHLDAVERNLDSFLGLNKQVVLMVTLGKHNFQQPAAIVKWAKSRGCSGVVFERFIPLGKGLSMKQEALDLEQWLKVCTDLGELADQCLDSMEASIYKAFWIRFGHGQDELLGALCNLGDESMALMPAGDVYPCRRLPIRVGNVMTTSFERIMAKLEMFSVANIRPTLHGASCKTCKYEQCAGCRAMAMALTGDFLSDDPLCPDYLQINDEDLK